MNDKGLQVDFHPVTNSWFQEHFQAPTGPQARGWPHIQKGGHVLISAPTGSGKTLAAFLASIDQLFREQLEGDLPDETRVLYVSPLKALSNDIHRNLTRPLEEIATRAEAMGYRRPGIRAALRTGDTSAAERRKITQKPPHILVTTPESLYLLLTSDSGRRVLQTVRTLIVDEIHAMVAGRRGAHLALSMERLAALTGQPLQRIGLSATQKPMSLVAHFLVGARFTRSDSSPDCAIIDEGHLRRVDLALEIPDSPLEAVMANEVWDEIYQRLIQLIESHHTTLIFVNTRRLAERMTYNLANKLGEDQVASHHGSLSLGIRRKAETRLKSGNLRVLVATASMELGIDIGSVDLVCQIGSPRSIATLLQRIGRSGHHYGGTPKGRLFPLTRDELIECTALLHSARHGILDALVIQECPLDVLCQQIVAAVSCEDWDEHELFQLFRGAWLYRNLSEETFKSLVYMLADGFTTKRGRRGAWVHYDGVNGRLEARKGARMTALTNGGAIPDNADYRVVMEPTGTFVGTVNEDFAIESLPGNVFRLGNSSWRILKIENGLVRVEDAQGMPPTIPFWFGEAPSRTDELSVAISDFREAFNRRMDNDAAINRFLREDMALGAPCADQIHAYLKAAGKALGTLPTRDRVVIERFFDEAGGMQLVIHALFGSRINRAWGLALRKRFCRSFNFELQAAATEDAIVLSLGPKHSFPLDDVFSFLNPKTVRDVLVQALLDAPMFQTRWRWTASRSLALVRQRGSRRIPPNIQRMEAEDLIAVVFPDQLACLENIAGDREVPDHPLVGQTIDDCLNEAMSIDGLEEMLGRMAVGDIECVAVDLPEPSPLCHEVLNAQPYAFLDDAPLEERRTQAVYLKRTLDPETIRDQGILDQEAVDTVREQAWPDARTAGELHEALMLMGAMPLDRFPDHWREPAEILTGDLRAGVIGVKDSKLMIAAERLPLWQTLYPEIQPEPAIEAPPREREQEWDAVSAVIELIRGFMELCGPTTAGRLARWFALETTAVQQALAALEAEGMILRGSFDKHLEGQQWCNRRLLARIHHLTIKSSRERIKPVTAHQFMRFLFHWQGVHPETRLRQVDGLEAACELLEGFEAAAGAWEKDLLVARVKGYSNQWLDQLCLQGRVGWARINPPKSGSFSAGPLKTTPISLFPRANTDLWCRPLPEQIKPSGYAIQVIEVLERQGASFFAEILKSCGLLHSQLEDALGELVALGMATCDSFAGLRALLVPANKRPSPHRRARMRRMNTHGISYAGRWSLVSRVQSPDEDPWERLEYQAMNLLHRYGIIFRKLLERESQAPPWRDLMAVYRRMEAVGEIRGGRFVEGFSGEQFALPEALKPLRAQKDAEPHLTLINLSASDPLNLTGIIIPGRAISQKSGNRVLFRDGLPVAAWEGGNLEKWDQNLDDQQLMSHFQHKNKNRPNLSNPLTPTT